mmetsp:Transcript_24535/g.48026  ORF Transcript_24535/g.48026 Transcript_24535/m.48026 type:complete len:378 (-) Transcript_24535:278-1411(-)
MKFVLNIMLLAGAAPLASAGVTMHRSGLTARVPTNCQKRKGVLGSMSSKLSRRPMQVPHADASLTFELIGAGVLGAAAWGIAKSTAKEPASVAPAVPAAPAQLAPAKTSAPAKKPSMAELILEGGMAQKTPKYYAKQYPSKKLDELFAGNKKWSENMMSNKPELMEKLGSMQEPKIMYIGCADSRVPENTISNMDPGEIFVVRNVANQVQLYDNSVMSALQFGVGALGVEDIIVAGHYGCGGVKASMANNDHGAPLEQWISSIRDVYRLHQKDLDSIADPQERTERLIQLNTVEQCLNVLRAGPVQKRRMETMNQPGGPIPRVHACVYDPATGKLTDMDVDIEKYISGYTSIYDLNYKGALEPRQKLQPAPSSAVAA